MNVLGREIPNDDIRLIAGARCWVVDGYIVKATKESHLLGHPVKAGRVKGLLAVNRWRAEEAQ